MTIAEFAVWLEQVEPGREDCAVKDSFQVALQNPATLGQLETAIGYLEGTDREAFILSVGHLIAMLAIEQVFRERGREVIRPNRTITPQSRN